MTQSMDWMDGGWAEHHEEQQRKWEERLARGLHDWHVVQANERRVQRGLEAMGFRVVDMSKGYPREELKVQPSFKHIESLPILAKMDVSGVMGIPPKVEYGREKDTIIRDERQGDPSGD